MSFSSSDSNSFGSPSSVGYPEPGISSQSSSRCYEDDEESLTETNSSLSTATEDVARSPVTYENIDSDCSDYSTDNSFQEFNLKDWLKLTKVLVSKNETVKSSPKLVQRYDELQEFFYFFAVEYFTTDEDTTEFVNNKRTEFMLTWEGLISQCYYIFDLLVDLLDDINVENSFGSSFL